MNSSNTVVLLFQKWSKVVVHKLKKAQTISYMHGSRKIEILRNAQEESVLNNSKQAL